MLPTGDADGATPARTPRAAVTFDAASSPDPDSAITGYDWDFDGNGTVDRNTTAPTTAFAYPAPGTFTPNVAVKDFRGGAGTASTTVTVAVPSGGPGTGGGTTPPSALPKITIARSGTKGSFTIRVTCAERCKLSGKLTISKAGRRRRSTASS